MALLRWTVGAVVLSLFLPGGLLPGGLLPEGTLREAGNPGVVRAQNETGKPPPASVRSGEQLAPFVATPMLVVEKMLEMAEVTARDAVYDLGSGDGRILLRAAEKYGAKAVGVEMDAHLVQESRRKARELNLEDLVTIVQGDLLQTNLKPATVVTIYLLPEATEKLRPLLERDLSPGARVVAHHARVPGWRAAREEAVRIGDNTHFVYLYRIPDAFQRN